MNASSTPQVEFAPSSLLRPEMAVRLEIADGEWAGVYKTRVASVAGEHLQVEAPLRAGYFVPVRPETPLAVHAASRDGLLSFETVVVDRNAEKKCPTLLIQRPSCLLVTQRRAAFRVRTTLPVRWAMPGRASTVEPTEFSATLRDLSIGGVLLRGAQPSQPRLHSGDPIYVRLPAADRIPEMRLSASVLHAEPAACLEQHDQCQEVHVQFTGLSVREEDVVARLVRFLERAKLRERQRLYAE